MNTPLQDMNTNISRRRLLFAGGAALTAGFFWLRGGIQPANAALAGHFEITHSDAEWKARLSEHQYEVLRLGGTERPYTSPMNYEKHKGVFACAGCALDLFSSGSKFESGTGWPSFWQPLANAVGETRDTSYGMERIEVHCRRCGGHLGHVFNDGPPPTGLRYCINGVALIFKAA